MISLRIISVGKSRETWIEEGVDHYKKLISKHARIEDEIVRAEKVHDESQKAIVLDKEAGLIESRIKGSNPLIVLDETGKNMSSNTLTELLDQYFIGGKNEIDFVIGSALGLSPQLKKRADHLLSLSKMTFPHELTRLILAEQLYRAMSIRAGSKYHK